MRPTDLRRAPAVALLLAALAACGPRPAPLPWVERDLRRHAGGDGAATPAGPAARDRGTLAEAQARLAAATADAPLALVTAAVDVAALGGDVAARRAELIVAVDQLDDAAVAAAAAAADPAVPPYGILSLRLALVAHHRGDDDAARAWLAARAGVAGSDGDDLAPRARALAAVVADVDGATIAVLLPLSGRFASIGQPLRAAIEAAPRDGATLVFLDTTGDEAGARAARRARAAHGAVAILGPVGEREAAAAARAAPASSASRSACSRPSTAPTRRRRLPPGRAEHRRGPRRRRGRRPRVAADGGGAGAARRRRPRPDRRVRRRGHRRRHHRQPHRHLRPDRVGPRARHQGVPRPRPATNPRLAAHLRRHGKKGWQTFSPDVDFAALYIPDTYDHAALVVAFLPYLGVELHTEDFPDPDALARKHGGRIPQVVQLIGGSGWNHPGLLTRGGDLVEGAMIVDVCSPVTAAARGDDLPLAPGGDGAAITASAPALQAYDAARLLLAARAVAAGAGASAPASGCAAPSPGPASTPARAARCGSAPTASSRASPPR
ncbi:MAG: hypothetical protein H6708_18720 [Kofleriaceae bacterium]|nr:hypothetical protein [Kofleriaceae bacterium]